MNPIKFLLILISVLAMNSIQAQDYRALRFGKYSGVNAVQFNPAYHRNSAINFDIQFGSLGFDISNNYFRFDRISFLQLIKDRDALGEKFNNPIDDVDDIDSIFQIEYFDFKNTRAHIDAEIAGPGFILHFDKFSIGAFSKLKVMSHMNNMPNWEDANALADLTFGVPFDFPLSNFSIASWMEFGLNLSTTLERDEYSYLHIGGSLKYYQAYDLLFVRSLKRTEATKFRDSTHYENGEFDAAYFNGFTYDEGTEKGEYKPEVHGRGNGIDIGAVYEYKTSSFDDTSIKFGASIHDIGYINYFNGQFHHIDLVDGYILKEKFLDEFFTTELSKNLDIDDKIYKENTQRKRILTPATLNLFMEYDITPNLFVNISLRENIPKISPLERASFLSAAGQYHTKWFSYTLPVSLYNHQFVHLGSAIKLGPITIGSDNFLPLFLPMDLNSANFYFGLNINSSMFEFLQGKFKRKGKLKGNKSSGSTKKVKCYYFN